MPAEVRLPRPGPKAHICVWSDFTLSHIDELNSLQQVEQIRSKIAHILQLNADDKNSKNKILVDLFYFAYRFAKDCNFNEEQTSAFLSIVKRTHEKAVETPFGNVDATYEHFKELLLRHCVKRPPFSVQLYNMAESKQITDYVLETYFKHFKLYKYAFTPKIRLNLAVEYNGLPEPKVETAGDDEGLKEETESELKVDVTEETEEIEVEDPPAVKELKALINSTLTDQVHKLKANMDLQLKSNEELIMKKLAEASGAERGPSRRSRKK